MRAECRARVNDVAGAKADLETLRKSRMSVGDATVTITDPAEMLKFVLDERIREFALQGHRWLDMRRLSTDPLFAGKTYTHQVLSKTGEVITSFPLKAERFTFRIPGKIMDINPGTVNNP
ncbi:SusD family protein [compost metagenome]